MRPWTHQSWLTRYVPCVRRHVHDNGAIALPPRFLKSGSELALGVPRRPDSDTYRKVEMQGAFRPWSVVPSVGFLSIPRYFYCSLPICLSRQRATGASRCIPRCTLHDLWTESSDEPVIAFEKQTRVNPS